MFIDADTHVDECEETWGYLPAALRYLAPRTIEFEKDQIPSWYGLGYERMWFIDGQLYPRRYRSDELTGTTPAQRELRDISGRIQDMDDLDVGIQVLYTTLFLEEVTLRPEVDVALCQSYNRWLADRCADTKGRLRWVAMVPYTSIPDALKELQWAKEHGASGIFKRGFEAGDRAVSDPYFFDIYSSVVDHDLALCLHAATAWTPISRNTTSVRVSMLGAGANISAFQTFVSSRVPERFPELKIGFIESGSAWLTFVLPALAATLGRFRREELLERSDETGWARAMREMHLFVTSELQEDIGYLVSNVGDDNLMIGSDYSHSDRSAVKDACERTFERSDIDKDTAVKMTNTNAAVFYGFEGY